MDNKQLGTSGSKKPRLSKGKLKKSNRNRKTSQGFSSSFTQKTLHNNTLLAQSLAKEKSRNEKLLVLHRELMTSRNEALMRLNETEASFDRLGTLVQKSIRQMNEVALTMGDVFAEIRASKNNPRDSASMRSSWDETVSTAGCTMLKQPVCHTNGMQENIVVNDQFPQWPLPSPPLPVSPIEEELDMTCSDEDTLREDSIVSRRAPTPRQPTDRECGETQPPHRRIRKVQRGMVRLPGHDFGSAPSWSEECGVNDRTSLSVVDMEETVCSADTPRSGKLPSFNTETGGRGDERLSYEDVFCGLAESTSCVCVIPASSGQSSPDFLGSSNDNTDRPSPCRPSSLSREETRHTPDLFPFESSSPKRQTGGASTTAQSSVPGGDEISRKKVRNRSPGLAQDRSKPSDAGRPNARSLTVEASSTSSPPGGNVLRSTSTKTAVLDANRPKLSKHADHNLVVANASEGKSPSHLKSAKIRHLINLERSDASDQHGRPSKSSKAVLKRSPTPGNADVSTKPDVEGLPTAITSLKTWSAGRSVRSVEVSSETTTHVPERTRSPTLVPSESTRHENKEIQDENEVANSGSAMWKVSNEGLGLETPVLETAREPPLETRSAYERGPAARPEATSRSAGGAGRPKRLPPSTADTPSRGPKAKTPKVVALIDDARGSRERLAREQDSTERRTRRRIAQANYKEPSLHAKIRRPV